MGNLAELNDLRREAKTLKIKRYNTMSVANLRIAIAEAQKDANTVLVGVGTMAGRTSLSDVEQGLQNETEIEDLRAEFPGADADRQEEIRVRLAQLGAVVYPPGTPEHEQYTVSLRQALAEWAEQENRAPLDTVAEPDEDEAAFSGEALPEPGEVEHPDGPGYVRVAFERIGRSRGMFAVTVKADTPIESIETEVYRLARRYLTSTGFAVTVDILAGKAWIEGGRYGTGTVMASNEEGEPVVSTVIPSAVPGHEIVEFPGEVPFRHLGNFQTLATLCGLTSEDGTWGSCSDLTPVDCLGCLDAYTSR